MEELGFKQTMSDRCVFVNHRSDTLVGVYVDDGIVISSNLTNCTKLIENLNTQFKTREVTNGTFLGMKLDKGEKGLRISQKIYIEHLLIKYNADNCRERSTPYFELAALEDYDNDDKTDQPYRGLIGSVQYLANCTRPDVLFAINFLAKYNNDPRVRHWMAAKSILRYLKYTKDYCLVYRAGSIGITGYSDASWANSSDGYRSVSGYVITVASSPILFVSRRQPNIALSSTEAEYVAASEAVKDLVWLTQFLSELRIQHTLPEVLIDNQSTIRQIKNLDTQKRSRHVDLRYHYVRSSYLKGLFHLKYINTENQVADCLTKLLNGRRLEQLVREIGLVRGS